MCLSCEFGACGAGASSFGPGGVGCFSPAAIGGLVAAAVGGVIAEITHGFGLWGKPAFHGSLKPRPSTPNAPSKPGNPCSGADPSKLNYNVVNNYRSGPTTALQHIIQNHINSVPGKSRYFQTWYGGQSGAILNMMRVNALTLTQGTLISASPDRAVVLSYV